MPYAHGSFLRTTALTAEPWSRLASALIDRLIGVTFVHHGATEIQREPKIGNRIGRAPRLPRVWPQRLGRARRERFLGTIRLPDFFGFSSLMGSYPRGAETQRGKEQNQR